MCAPAHHLICQYSPAFKRTEVRPTVPLLKSVYFLYLTPSLRIARLVEGAVDQTGSITFKSQNRQTPRLPTLTFPILKEQI